MDGPRRPGAACRREPENGTIFSLILPTGQKLRRQTARPGGNGPIRQKFRARALTTHFSKFRHYECHLHRRAGMDFARRKTRIPRGDGPSGGENVRSGRTGRLNRLAGCLPGARHYQTHVAVLPGKRPCAVLPYRGKVFLPPKRRRSLSRSEDRTASCGTSHLSFH